jgi:hypothetical protein
MAVAAIMLRTRQSRVEAAFFVGREDALAGDHERGCAQGNAASFRGAPNLFEGVENDFFEALIDLVLGPKIAGEILHPLEIAYRHAARIADYIRNDDDPP